MAAELTAAVWQPLVYDAPPAPYVLTAEGQTDIFIAFLRERTELFIAGLRKRTELFIAQRVSS